MTQMFNLETAIQYKTELYLLAVALSTIFANKAALHKKFLIYISKSGQSGLASQRSSVR